jgi:hypothetical protein
MLSIAMLTLAACSGDRGSSGYDMHFGHDRSKSDRAVTEASPPIGR